MILIRFFRHRFSFWFFTNKMVFSLLTISVISHNGLGYVKTIDYQPNPIEKKKSPKIK